MPENDNQKAAKQSKDKPRCPYCQGTGFLNGRTRVCTTGTGMGDLPEFLKSIFAGTGIGNVK